MTARNALQELKRRDPEGTQQWMRAWDISPPTEREAWNELIATSAPHGTILFDSPEQAHDALMVEMDRWLRETKGTADFPGEQRFCKTMLKLWMEHWRYYAPRG